ncbi:MAG: hypothetical protein NTU53_16445 [Planctomycetota bacterium]|nr:hypothetical protein [Planctomycetota bacterium]
MIVGHATMQILRETIRHPTTKEPDYLVEVPSLGTPVGICDCTGHRQRVCIPEAIRLQHVHLIGTAGPGKTDCMVHMVFHDVNEGHGAAVIGPRGEMVVDLLRRLSPGHLDCIIYLNPGEPDWVPIWNPLKCGTGQGAARVVDDIVRAFQGFVSGMGEAFDVAADDRSTDTGHHFARSMGKLAKTDTLDARMLAEFAKLGHVRLSEKEPKNQANWVFN